MATIALKPVDGKDYAFLYELLQEKTPEQNISHTHMPTYADHVAFNDKQPYSKDYIILQDGEQVGRIYLTKQDEVGIHIKKEYAKQGIGGNALELLITMVNRPLLANIAPSNLPSQAFFTKHGFRLVQHTYRRD